MNNQPNRKKLRLESFDYAGSGYYFITICTKDKQHLFGTIVGNGQDRSLRYQRSLVYINPVFPVSPVFLYGNRPFMTTSSETNRTTPKLQAILQTIPENG